MIPETISTLEVVRLIVAVVGMRAAWVGRLRAKHSGAEIPDAPTSDPHERATREQRGARMALFQLIQGAFLMVHTLLLVNVLANFAYPSSPIEQPNVMTSNLAQILIPIILTKVSETISMEMTTALRLIAVTGPRPRVSEVAP